jgi:hypothetical protein
MPKVKNTSMSHFGFLRSSILVGLFLFSLGKLPAQVSGEAPDIVVRDTLNYLDSGKIVEIELKTGEIVFGSKIVRGRDSVQSFSLENELVSIPVSEILRIKLIQSNDSDRKKEKDGKVSAKTYFASLIIIACVIGAAAIIIPAFNDLSGTW